MGSPAQTVERLIWLVSIIAAYSGGNLLLNLPSCINGEICNYQEMFDWKIGISLLILAFISIIIGLQAMIARTSKRKTWVSIFFDDRLREEVIQDAKVIDDDVTSISDGWAILEEQHLSERLEEE